MKFHRDLMNPLLRPHDPPSRRNEGRDFQLQGSGVLVGV